MAYLDTAVINRRLLSDAVPSQPAFFLSRHVALRGSSEGKVTFKERDIHLNDGGGGAVWIWWDVLEVCETWSCACLRISAPWSKCVPCILQCLSIIIRTHTHTGTDTQVCVLVL